MAHPAQKVDFTEALTYLMTELDRVDSSDLSQSQRTQQYKRIAAKVINTYLKDGDNHKHDKLGITTLNKYLTRLRTAVRAANYRHHSLTNEKARGWTTTNKETGAVRNYVTLSKLIGDYPEYAETLETLCNEHALTLRKRVKEIASEILGKQPTKRQRELYRLITSGLKVEHEILFHLALDSAQKAMVKQHQGNALERKQHDSVTISHAAIMGIISEYLAAESLYKQLYALALCCGRRFIEVAKQGNFEPLGEHRVMFSGQAKKRAGHVEKPYPIYTLIPATEFIAALERLRESPELAAIHAKVEEKKRERGMVTPDFDNAAFNTMTATSANHAAKNAMLNRGMAQQQTDGNIIYNDTSTTVTFKDSRAIYAAICLQEWHEKDAPQLDDNAFVSQLMGHEGGTAHLNYRQFRIKRDLPAFLLAVNTDVAGAQLEAANGENTADLDAAFSALSDVRDSIKRCHEKVMQWAALNPANKLTQTSIEKEAKGGNRAVVKDYMAALKDAIESYNKRLLKS